MEEIFVKDTHRALWYEDGVLTQILEAGYYKIPRQQPRFIENIVGRRTKVEVVLVDMRERDITIKGQEILTKDKVAIRVSIIVRFRITDPKAAIHEVENYEERIYTDVQLAARRSLSSMTLEEIMTNRNRLSEDILADVTESATGYGVSIRRADVKDLIFPGNLQDIMNRVLSAERVSEARIIEARAQAEVSRIQAQNNAEIQKLEAETEAESIQRTAEAKARAQSIQAEAETNAMREREKTAALYDQYPALLRLEELEALRHLSDSSNTRIYIDFARQAKDDAEQKGEV